MVEREEKKKQKESKMEADVCRARSRGDCLDVPQRQSCRQCRGPSYRVTVVHIATSELFRIYLLSPCFHKACFLYYSLVLAHHYVSVFLCFSQHALLRKFVRYGTYHCSQIYFIVYLQDYTYSQLTCAITNFIIVF